MISFSLLFQCRHSTQLFSLYVIIFLILQLTTLHTDLRYTETEPEKCPFTRYIRVLVYMCIGVYVYWCICGVVCMCIGVYVE